ncbi:MAG TPA: proprotein convertase P-domain-containing protein, partial [Terriglobales bacterium]|nr:proprotein convertase P-domain-containing protein [Terriglobales bacterium]
MSRLAIVFGSLLFSSLAAAQVFRPDLVPEITDAAVSISDVDPGDVVEGCAGGASDRLLVEYSLRTRNIGQGDLVMGSPGCPNCQAQPGAMCSNPLYVCSPAHGHAHFEGFAYGELLDSNFNVVAASGKYGFCLLDVECSDPFYTCAFQGLSAGCADVYDRGLPCQYIDITDANLPPGDYTIRVTLDPENQLVEENELNNTVEGVVTIPASSTSCPRTSSADAPKSIPDNGHITSFIDVTTSGWITNLRILDLAGSHSRIGDLEIHLTGPSGRDVVVMNRVCSGSSGSFAIDLDNAATSPIACPPVDGQPHRPSQSLAAFLGEEASGRWLLTIYDKALGNVGYLSQWALEICTELACASPLVFSSTDVPKAVPDHGTVSSRLTVPVGSGQIGRVEVLGLRGTHPYVGDLEFQLVSPNGRECTILSRVCGSADNFDLSLSSLAGTAVPCPPTDGFAHLPAEAFTAFLAEPAEGQWTLNVYDRDSTDVGTLSAWGLRICPLQSTAATCPQAPAEGCQASDRGQLTMKDSDNPSRRRLSWKWKGGDSTLAQFGLPVGKTGYAACVYRDQQLVQSLPIGSNGM